MNDYVVKDIYDWCLKWKFKLTWARVSKDMTGKIILVDAMQNYPREQIDIQKYIDGAVNSMV